MLCRAADTKKPGLRIRPGSNCFFCLCSGSQGPGCSVLASLLSCGGWLRAVQAAGEVGRPGCLAFCCERGRRGEEQWRLHLW